MTEKNSGIIRVAVVEPEPAARYGICRYLEQLPLMRICQELDSPGKGQALFNGSAPNVALIDSECDGGGGLQLIKRAHLSSPRFPCVAWIRSGNPSEVRRALKAGARGIVCRREPLTEVALALQAAFDGETHLSPMAGAALGDGMRCASGFGGSDDHLPSRQRQVFRMLGNGIGALDIARRLGISHKTVNTHIDRLKLRMNCPNKAVLCRLAALDSAREGEAPSD